MACMEHSCVNKRCDWMSFSNDSGPSECPECGSKVVSHWDEEFTDWDDEWDCDEEEDDEEEDDWSEYYVE